MNENFAPFELAVKLEEKGFPLEYKFETKSWSAECKRIVVLPNIYKVLKWLREEKKIHIIVEIADSGWYYTIYPNVRWENGKLKSDKYIMSFKHKVSWEQAALAGIEYVLDNLI